MATLSKMVADAIKEELTFMRTLQVYHRESFHPSQAGCARNQESERVDTSGREQHVCGHTAIGEPQDHAQSTYDWQAESTC